MVKLEQSERDRESTDEEIVSSGISRDPKSY
jgi:hypothetical protein